MQHRELRPSRFFQVRLKTIALASALVILAAAPGLASANLDPGTGFRSGERTAIEAANQAGSLDRADSIAQFRALAAQPASEPDVHDGGFMGGIASAEGPTHTEFRRNVEGNDGVARSSWVAGPGDDDVAQVERDAGRLIPPSPADPMDSKF